MGKWKAVRPDPDGKLELYDLEADISESHDLAAENPEVMAQVEKYLRDARVPAPEAGPAGAHLVGEKGVSVRSGRAFSARRSAGVNLVQLRPALYGRTLMYFPQLPGAGLPRVQVARLLKEPGDADRAARATREIGEARLTGMTARFTWQSAWTVSVPVPSEFNVDACFRWGSPTLSPILTDRPDGKGCANKHGRFRQKASLPTVP